METVKLGLLIKKTKVARCGEHSYPVLSITKQDGIIMQSEKFKKRIASADTSDYKIIPRGKLVQGIHIDEGNFGIQDIVDNGIVSPAYGVWNVNDGLVIPKYLEMVLRSPKSIEFYRSKLTGTVNRRGHMSDADFLSMDIPLPDRDTQSKILKTMKQTTSVLYSRQQQLAKLDELIKARFVEMFGDPIQNEKCWEIKSLFDLGYCKNGMNFHKGDHGVEIHCLGVGDFKDRSTIHEVENLPFVALNESPDPDYLLQDGDIVFVRSNGNKELVGRCLAIYPANVPVTYSGFCIRYRLTSEEASVAYLLRVLKADSVRKKMAGRGANIQNLNQQTLSQLAIPLPPLSLQNQFADFVAEVDKSKLFVELFAQNACILAENRSK